MPRRSTSKLLAISLMVLSILLATPYLANIINTQYSTSHAHEYEPTGSINGWAYQKISHDAGDTPLIRLADYAEEGVFVSGENKIDFYMYAYWSAKDSKEIIHHNNVVFDKKLWTMISKKPVSVNLDHKEYSINEYLVSKGDQSRIIRYFYLVNGQFVTSASAVKLNELFVKLRGKPMDSRLYVFSIPVKGDYSHADKTLDTLLSKVIKNLAIP